MFVCTGNSIWSVCQKNCFISITAFWLHWRYKRNQFSSVCMKELASSMAFHVRNDFGSLLPTWRDRCSVLRKKFKLLD